MSQENVEIVRAFYEAFNRLDWDAAWQGLHADFEVTTPPGPNAGTYRGREELRRWREEMLSAFEAVSVEVVQLVEKADHVAAVVRVRARPKGASAEIEFRNGNLWTFRDGKAVSSRVFPRPEDALEAAGLEE
jgi:ketosteroid isomerase-like protein